MFQRYSAQPRDTVERSEQSMEINVQKAAVKSIRKELLASAERNLFKAGNASVNSSSAHPPGHYWGIFPHCPSQGAGH